ncbi:CDP-glucose 4,6-dehydratase [Mucilaginibacter segetis]|uniref:CDP-glucose 4,6-dehydratase n=1 Tax=Mucilaginibacter segetis TaxID=2793071 RepID=A0A934PW55_9SPHI|nr:CDP-glucose 4,6-dehydratase [Mucilaginibacter segetis]MBK0381134.1 CDP-glucose 4,6-dehydratase [Mucilaginibacter segetis]
MFTDLKNIYQGKKVFLTGHTGFKGSWLLKILNLTGAIVRGYSLIPETEPNLYSLINGNELCDSIIGDLRNREDLKRAVVDFQPDFIFHLAAQPLVRLSYEIPSETFEINAIGTANILDALKLLNKPVSVVLITTDKVYHNNEWDHPYRESDQLGGYDPYSASKGCAEIIIDSYRNSFFNNKTYHQHQKAIAVGRAGNVIGGGDWAKDRLIPDIVRALSKNQRIEIRNPRSVRPWQHVLEPLSGYLELGAKLATHPLKYSQAYNFGPDLNDALAVSDMVNMAIDCWGGGDYYFNKDVNQLHEAGLLKLDISKAKAQLNWIPKMDASQAVKNTINWYKHFYNNGDVVDYTTMQILNFFDG